MKAVFIPVSVNYDRIFEERSFAKEISGAGEKPESSSEFARARRQMKKSHGRVYLSFGTPVDYRSLMNNCGGNLGAAAEHIAAEVNRGMKVSLSAFTSLAAMSREGTGFYYNDLLGFADTLKSYMDSEKIPGGEIFSSGTDSSEILRSGLKMFADSGLLSEEGSGDDIFYIMKPGFRQRIFYYRNTIAHHFALPACAAAGLLAALRESGRASRAESDKLISKTAVLLEAEFPGFNIDTDNLERVLNFFKEAGLLAEDDSGFHVKDAGAETLKLLSNIARDIIESHFIVLTAGSSFGDAPYNEENLINECRAGGTRLYHMGYLRCDEALSVMQYKNIVASYTRHGVISATDDNEGLLKTNDTPVQEWKGLVSELLTTMDRAPRTLPEPVKIKV